ncbi:unnamed protein product [Absidia cylindrospora]
MFRKNSSSVSGESSFHSGKASIILENNTLEDESYDHHYFYESTPYQYQYQYGDNLNRPLPPTPSLERTSTQTTSSSCFSLTEEEHQHSSNKIDEPLTLESMSAVIAAAVQMSSGGIKSSLSMGHASIKQPQKQQEKVKRRFSLFSWKKQQQQQQQEQIDTSPRSSCSTVVDDGRDELAYRGIHIKEIKTTLKPMVIPTNVTHPMPIVTMERPGFARINY